MQRAIWAGDNVTCGTIMDMEAGLDTGPMRAKHVTPIEDKPAGVLTMELARAGADLMVEELEDLDAQPPVPQPEAGVPYAAKIEKAEARTDVSQRARVLDRHYLDLNHTPGDYFTI